MIGQRVVITGANRGLGLELARVYAQRGDEVVAGCRRPGDAEELRALVAAAGFRDITIRPVAGMVRFPSAARLVQDYVAGSPLASHVAKVSDEARAALVSEVGHALTSYLAGGVLTFPIEAHLASAKK